MSGLCRIWNASRVLPIPPPPPPSPNPERLQLVCAEGGRVLLDLAYCLSLSWLGSCEKVGFAASRPPGKP